MRAVIGIGIEEEDRKHTWMEDADSVCPAVMLVFVVLFFFNLRRLNWSLGNEFISGSRCDSHNICLPLASLPLSTFLYHRSFFRFEFLLSKTLVL